MAPKIFILTGDNPFSAWLFTYDSRYFNRQGAWATLYTLFTRFVAKIYKVITVHREFNNATCVLKNNIFRLYLVTLITFKMTNFNQIVFGFYLFMYVLPLNLFFSGCVHCRK